MKMLMQTDWTSGVRAGAEMLQNGFAAGSPEWTEVNKSHNYTVGGL